MINLTLNSDDAEKHFLLVKDVIQNRIKNIIKKKSTTINGVSSALSPVLKAYLETLLGDTELKMLIVSTPEQLEGIISTIKTHYPTFITNPHADNSVLKNLFVTSCYENAFIKRDFIKQIPVDTCPYCNRNYIYYLSETGGVKPQIDHFYPKNKYPFLGVSFYNLIPSCQTCNGVEAKGEKDPIDFGVTNPYMLDFPVFKFTYKMKSVNIFNSRHDKTSVSLTFKNCPKGYNAMFKLDKLYEQHSDHVIELIIKSKLEYSKRYRDYLMSYKGITFSDKEINRMIVGNFTHEDDLHKRPLAKLYKDIADDLGLTK